MPKKQTAPRKPRPSEIKKAEPPPPAEHPAVAKLTTATEALTAISTSLNSVKQTRIAEAALEEIA